MTDLPLENETRSTDAVQAVRGIKLLTRVKHCQNPLQKYYIWDSLQFILQNMYKYTFTASEKNTHMYECHRLTSSSIG